MTSWLGGLSSLKGHLSHLITEGTEEISGNTGLIVFNLLNYLILDPNVELTVAKKKILELEAQLNCDVNKVNYSLIE